MVIIGTLIGAGFASGREIYLFFMKYGKLGQIGIIISGIFTFTHIRSIFCTMAAIIYIILCWNGNELQVNYLI